MNRHLLLNKAPVEIQKIDHVTEAKNISTAKDVAEIYKNFDLPAKKKKKAVIKIFEQLWQPFQNKNFS